MVARSAGRRGGRAGRKTTGASGSATGARGRYQRNGQHLEWEGKRYWIPSEPQFVRAQQLIAMHEQGRIGRLVFEYPVPLSVNGKKITTYRVDAVYDVLDSRGRMVHRTYEEVKGAVTPDWKIKRALFDALMDRPLAVIMASGTSPVFNEDGTRARLDGKALRTRGQWMREQWADRLPDAPPMLD